MFNDFYTLITGASEGLGKAFALECASRKMNLVLVSLPNSGLAELANFIRRNFHVSVYAFEKDLSRSSGCYDLFLEIENANLQLNVLINNAGIGSTMEFVEGSPEFYEKQIGVNVLAVTIISHLFIKKLQSPAPSYILNVGSMASFCCLPKKQVYGASKSYIYYFSKSLGKELKNKSVHVAVLCPGGVNTNLSVTLMNRNAPWSSRISIMNPEEVAPIALDGLLKKKKVIIPGRLNRFFFLLNKIVPAPIKTLLTNSAMKKLNPDKMFTTYFSKPDAIKPAA
jgi:short-subunit dehydrogenase